MMTDQADSASLDLEQFLVEQIKQRGYVSTLLDVLDVYWVPISAVVAVTAILSWFFRGLKANADRRQIQATARKLEGETANSQFDLLKNLEIQNQELLSLDAQSCGLLSDLRNAVPAKGYKLLRRKRDEICQFQSSVHMPKFLNYLAFCHQLLGSREFRHKVQERFLPGAQSHRHLIQALNSDSMVKRVKTAAPLKIRRSEIDSMFSRMRSATPWYAVHLWGLRYDIYIERKAWKTITRKG